MITCLFTWVIAIIAVATVIISAVPSLQIMKTRWDIGIGITIALFCLWIGSALSVGDTVFPSGYTYPWTAINNGLHYIYPASKGVL